MKCDESIYDGSVPASGQTGDALANPRPELLQDVYSAPLAYVVDFQRVAVRRSPSTAAVSVGVLFKGERILGYPQGQWLCVAGAAFEGCWILIDGARLSLGRLLRPLGCSLQVVRTLAEAVVLTWERLPARAVEYRIQWCTQQSPGMVHNVRCESMNGATIHELPHESQLRIRLVAVIIASRTDSSCTGRGQDFAVLHGNWEEVETERPIDELEEADLCCDPLANLRGKCMDCSCRGYVLAEYGDRKPGETLSEVLCRRCGCSCTRHVVLGEFRYAGAKSEAGAQSHAGKERQSLPGIEEKVLPLACCSSKHVVSDATWRPENAPEGEERLQFVLTAVRKAATLYGTLGVSPTASDVEVRSAYRRVSLQVHPDKVVGRMEPELVAEAEAAFKIVSAAYEVLGSDASRTRYDQVAARSTIKAVGRARLSGASFLNRFLFGRGGSQGWDLKARPPGSDWVTCGSGVYRKSIDLHVTVTHAISGEQLQLHVQRGTSILMLKRIITAKVRRGPESRIQLCSTDGAELRDIHHVAQADQFVLVGINLGPPLDIELCLRHAHTGARLLVKVQDTAAMKDVRETVAKQLGCTVDCLRLGCRRASLDCLKSFDDSELLNGRTEILILGADIELELSLDEAVLLLEDLIEAYKEKHVQNEIDLLLEDFLPPMGVANAAFREHFISITSRTRRETLAKHGFDGPDGDSSVMQALGKLHSEERIQCLAQQIDQCLRVTVGGFLPPIARVTVEADSSTAGFPTGPCSMTFTVPPSCTVSELRNVVAEHLGVESGSLQLARSSDTAHCPLSDTIGSCRSFNMLRIELPVSPSRAMHSGTVAVRSLPAVHQLPSHDTTTPPQNLRALPSPSEAASSAGIAFLPELANLSVLLVVTHATSVRERPVQLCVPPDTTIAGVKEALAAKLELPDVLLKGRFVERRGNCGSFANLRDGIVLGDRRRLMYMGTELRGTGGHMAQGYPESMQSRNELVN